ncbi:hypothetical protein L596_001618 [Steinernema carpocapsae]|uniref:Histone-lysine N-methyltransferase n=2 Tax=Steinernema carpocapsae TaxID=34508 RepID=A0A4U8UNS4_STECR|nr:hypothetical protein L596_001618 [Steinernema carpocapsae]
MENAKKLSIQHGRILKLLKVTKSPLPVHRDTYAARRMEAMSNAALMARNSKTGGDDVTREKLRPGSQAENTDPELLADFSTARTDCRENPAAQRAEDEQLRAAQTDKRADDTAGTATQLEEPSKSKDSVKPSVTSRAEVSDEDCTVVATVLKTPRTINGQPTASKSKKRQRFITVGTLKQKSIVNWLSPTASGAASVDVTGKPAAQVKSSTSFQSPIALDISDVAVTHAYASAVAPSVHQQEDAPDEDIAATPKTRRSFQGRPMASKKSLSRRKQQFIRIGTLKRKSDGTFMSSSGAEPHTAEETAGDDTQLDHSTSSQSSPTLPMHIDPSAVDLTPIEVSEEASTSTIHKKTVIAIKGRRNVPVFRNMRRSERDSVLASRNASGDAKPLMTFLNVASTSRQPSQDETPLVEEVVQSKKLAFSKPRGRSVVPSRRFKNGEQNVIQRRSESLAAAKKLLSKANMSSQHVVATAPGRPKVQASQLPQSSGLSEPISDVQASDEAAPFEAHAQVQPESVSPASEPMEVPAKVFKEQLSEAFLPAYWELETSAGLEESPRNDQDVIITEDVENENAVGTRDEKTLDVPQPSMSRDKLAEILSTSSSIDTVCETSDLRIPAYWELEKTPMPSPALDQSQGDQQDNAAVIQDTEAETVVATEDGEPERETLLMTSSEDEESKQNQKDDAAAITNVELEAFVATEDADIEDAPQLSLSQDEEIQTLSATSIIEDASETSGSCFSAEPDLETSPTSSIERKESAQGVKAKSVVSSEDANIQDASQSSLCQEEEMQILSATSIVEATSETFESRLPTQPELQTLPMASAEDEESKQNEEDDATVIQSTEAEFVVGPLNEKILDVPPSPMSEVEAATSSTNGACQATEQSRLLAEAEREDSPKLERSRTPTAEPMKIEDAPEMSLPSTSEYKVSKKCGRMRTTEDTAPAIPGVHSRIAACPCHEPVRIRARKTTSETPQRSGEEAKEEVKRAISVKSEEKGAQQLELNPVSESSSIGQAESSEFNHQAYAISDSHDEPGSSNRLDEGASSSKSSHYSQIPDQDEPPRKKKPGKRHLRRPNADENAEATPFERAVRTYHRTPLDEAAKEAAAKECAKQILVSYGCDPEGVMTELDKTGFPATLRLAIRGASMPVMNSLREKRRKNPVPVKPVSPRLLDSMPVHRNKVCDVIATLHAMSNGNSILTNEKIEVVSYPATKAERRKMQGMEKRLKRIDSKLFKCPRRVIPTFIEYMGEMEERKEREKFFIESGERLREEELERRRQEEQRKAELMEQRWRDEEAFKAMVESGAVDLDRPSTSGIVVQADVDGTMKRAEKVASKTKDVQEVVEDTKEASTSTTATEKTQKPQASQEAPAEASGKPEKTDEEADAESDGDGGESSDSDDEERPFNWETEEKKYKARFIVQYGRPGNFVLRSTTSIKNPFKIHPKLPALFSDDKKPSSDDGVYESERILMKRMHEGNEEFYVKWVDWPMDTSTWEVKSALRGSGALSAEFQLREEVVNEICKLYAYKRPTWTEKDYNRPDLRKLIAFERRVDLIRKDYGQPKLFIENIHDDQGPPNFQFVLENLFSEKAMRHMVAYHAHAHMNHCKCTTGRGCQKNRVKTATGYTNKGKAITRNVFRTMKADMAFIFHECNVGCSCFHIPCHNRMVQKGRNMYLMLFKTQDRGWGVFATQKIKAGEFVCEYVGLVKKLEEIRDTSYSFDMDGYGAENVELSIDAAVYGNEARFVNHSCAPNLVAASVRVEYDTEKYHRIAYIAKKDIAKGEELLINYYPNGLTKTKKSKKCLCGADKGICQNYI